MIKFIERWMKSDEDKAIEGDGALNTWMDPKDGLPSTDREVCVLVLCEERDGAGNYGLQRRYRSARFNPSIGWSMDGNRAAVIFWRDEDPTVAKTVKQLIQAV
jgi:hypothetical protein